MRYLLLLLLLLPSLAQGQWVKDWARDNLGADSVTMHSPGYYRGQVRGYFPLGGIRARWRVDNSNQYPFSATPPSFKAGCGGIDINMGAFSMVMDEEWLVRQFENIVQSSAAAAFDIALNTLCSVCTDTMKSLKAISDRINAIQLNSCRAGKKLAAYVMNPIADKKGQSEIQSTVANEEAMRQGQDDLYANVIANSEGRDITANGDVLSHCPAEIRGLFNPGSMMQSILSPFSLDQASIQVLRGVTGDLHIQRNHGFYQSTYIEPCSQNSNPVQTLIDGGGHSLVYHSNGSYSCNHTEHYTMVSAIASSMRSIEQKMTSRQHLSLAEKSFISGKYGLPFYSLIQSSIANESQDYKQDHIARYGAQAYISQMLEYIAVSIKQASLKAQSTLSSTSFHPGCRLDTIPASFEFLQRIVATAEKLQGDISRYRIDYNQTQQGAKELVQSERQDLRRSRSHLKNRFSLGER